MPGKHPGDGVTQMVRTRRLTAQSSGVGAPRMHGSTRSDVAILHGNRDHQAIIRQTVVHVNTRGRTLTVARVRPVLVLASADRGVFHVFGANCPNKTGLDIFQSDTAALFQSATASPPSGCRTCPVM